ncbi:MAG TPA: ABC transporter transmembrane domain-containing protein, partial [Vicingus sp.]|nr:ABC transporter transmembrane domain-containing protein [Vicingus sp.]
MKSLKYLNKYLFKYKYRLLLGTVFIVISNIFALYPAQIIRETFNLVEAKLSNKVIDSSSFFGDLFNSLSFGKAILTFGIIVFALALIKGLFVFFTRQTIIIMSRLIEYDLKNEIFNHFQLLDSSFYKENNTGDIMNRISEDVSKVRMYLGPGIMYSINLITL